jgi:bacteriorhodopsin
MDQKQNQILTLHKYVSNSFTFTFILLLTTGTITFIEAMRTQNRMTRHVLNLETCISIIAGYFYSVFIDKIDKYKESFDWDTITQTRYVDWSITTPLMLLSLCLVLGDNSKIPLHISIFILIILMNYSMLYIGYLGEVNNWNRIIASFFGFVPFIAMYSIIFIKFVLPKYRLDNYILFGLYAFVWGMYGIVYLLDQEYKNICYNILDLIAKCFIGLGLWAYYSKIFV